MASCSRRSRLKTTVNSERNHCIQRRIGTERSTTVANKRVRSAHVSRLGIALRGAPKSHKNSDTARGAPVCPKRGWARHGNNKYHLDPPCIYWQVGGHQGGGRFHRGIQARSTALKSALELAWLWTDSLRVNPTPSPPYSQPACARPHPLHKRPEKLFCIHCAPSH